ncbi:hypothetical protein [Actinoplanes sp. N902-109]|uniref:hypothetical protein n=1 Tax=Actinoplanes sp. (strain N902-109) TaxID=649831 RepID=UPI00032967F6|nr:hypothetical protein [Actinoplanes sp. N902-109]AGL15086.1 hypothetical protein L083_1576 [Actinoplanes sp. N902-109]
MGALTVCRDCCCGDAVKHPGVDHDAQLAAIRGAAGDRHPVRVSECLKVCERSNVVVVHPAPAARRAGARLAYLGDVLDDALIGAVVAWLDAGGPGVEPVPEVLRERVFDPADYAD